MARGKDRTVLFFHTTRSVKNKLIAVAAQYGVSVGQLLNAFATYCDTLVLCVPLSDQEAQQENRQLSEISDK